MSKSARPFSKIVVMGGSQGAIEALLNIMPSLPADLAAAFFVVVHISVESNGFLPRVLQRGCPLKVFHARDGEPIQSGNVYVAPPDYHVTLEGRTVHVLRGPRENRHRPAIDPLFRTAARSFGPRVIAVLLSGNFDDGSIGMLAVRRWGGVGIVQDPAHAEAAEMPRNALRYGGADYVLPVSQIAPKLIELIVSREFAMKKRGQSTNANKALAADQQVRGNEEAVYSGKGEGKPSVFACPECHGVLWEVKEGGLERFRCRVGHSYTVNSLKNEIDQSSETALWAAMRALEEKAAVTQRILNSINGSGSYAQRLTEQMQADRDNAHVIRSMIFQADVAPLPASGKDRKKRKGRTARGKK